MDQLENPEGLDLASYDREVVLNLAMLIRRLIRKHPDRKLAEQALGYLRREGLQGSCLRRVPEEDS